MIPSAIARKESKQSFANISNIRRKVHSEHPRHTSDKNHIQTNKTSPLISHMFYVSVSQIKTVQTQALEQKGWFLRKCSIWKVWMIDLQLILTQDVFRWSYKSTFHSVFYSNSGRCTQVRKQPCKNLYTTEPITAPKYWGWKVCSWNSGVLFKMASIIILPLYQHPQRTPQIFHWTSKYLTSQWLAHVPSVWNSQWMALCQPGP